MNLICVGTTRQFEKWASFDIVYEWEDDFKRCLNLKLEYKKAWHIGTLRRLPFVNLFARYWRNTFCFEMSPFLGDVRLDNSVKVVPCIIDFFLREAEMPKFIKNYSKHKIVLLSSRECLDFVNDYIEKNKVACFKTGHLPLSISDKYAITPYTIFDKQYDLVLMGRQNPVLEEFLKTYLETHKDLVYVYWKFVNGQLIHYTNKGECLGNIDTRDKYISLMRKARCGLYSTPGIDGGEARTNGFNQVTPRFLELIASGCHVIARYKMNADVSFFELNKFSPSVETYEQFESMLDNARTTDVNMKLYSDYLQKHYTSLRASQLVELTNLL